MQSGFITAFFVDMLNMCLHFLSGLNMGIHHMINKHRF